VSNLFAAAPWQREFLHREQLPAGYLVTAERYFDPLSKQLVSLAERSEKTLLVAINGAQGSGKSTLAAYLAASLEARFGICAVALSLDDFYLTRDARQTLARDVHPLLLTRGVPGTHDVALLQSTIAQLSAAQTGEPAVAVPSFDKSVDDRRPRGDWPAYVPPIRVILLEGWCLGARSVASALLSPALNELERSEDSSGDWRNYCNDVLRTVYEPFYDLVDYWVMLAAPAFEQVFSWRQDQEDKLAQIVHQSNSAAAASGLMNSEQLVRFVAHFERHTRGCLEQLPPRVDVLYQLGAQRQIIACRGLGLTE
jgi:D-glycerate 3-kinase